jgi:GT2 family glycosyltransferase
MLLSSLYFQTYKEFDVLILDDEYGTPLLISSQFIHSLISRLRYIGHGVKIIRNHVSYGVCKARQQLIDNDLWKENQYVLRLDDDQFLEPDYIERLIKVMEEKQDAGIVSGITPLLSGPDFRRHNKFVKPVINEIKLDDKGNITKYGDDCGTLYLEKEVLPAHQFRSSALIKREIFDKVKYETGLTNTGFREEAFLSLRALMLGYKIYVDTGAIAWHNPAPSGGCRAQDYRNRVMADHNNFLNWLQKRKEELKQVGL